MSIEVKRVAMVNAGADDISVRATIVVEAADGKQYCFSASCFVFDLEPYNVAQPSYSKWYREFVDGLSHWESIKFRSVVMESQIKAEYWKGSTPEQAREALQEAMKNSED